MASTPLATAWHDGQLMPLDKVTISPLDRGYLFGDGIYEVIPVYNGRPLGLELHLARLARSLDAIALPSPLSARALGDTLAQLIDANGGGNQSLYLQVSRSGDTGRDHRFPDRQTSHLFAMCSPLASIDAEYYAAGVRAIMMSDLRWARCDIKSTSLLANVLARQRANDAGAIEAILTRDGQITEGAASAVACVVDGVLIAPPETEQLLPSVTRQLAWSLADTIGQPTAIRDITIDECLAADEVILMSSTKELVPVVQVDDQTIGSGAPGAVWRDMFDAYQQLKGR